MADPMGIIARTIAAVRYAATGNAPAEWFGPGTPIQPMAPEQVKARQFDYGVAANLQYIPRSNEPVSFAKLKQLAETSGTLRMIIERQKDLVEALEWRIKPKLEVKGAATDAGVTAISEILEFPDGIHDWAQWLRAVLEQLFVIDAVSIYGRRTLAGELHSLEIIDGATIKPLLAQDGRRPAMPDASFQQVLKGIVAANFTEDELIYYPQNFRADRIYGYSRVEQFRDIVDTSIKRFKSQGAYFDEGNLGAGFFIAPEGFGPEQARDLETHWNNIMSGSVVNKRIVPWMPFGTSWQDTKGDLLADSYDEWLIRLMCFPFGIAPTPFLKQQGLGQGTGQVEQDAGLEAGTQSVMKYVRRLMNRILVKMFNRPDLEFVWSTDHEMDANTLSMIRDRDLKNGTITLDQAREQIGMDAHPDRLGAVPMIYGVATPLERMVAEPEPVVATLPAPELADDAAPLEKAAHSAVETAMTEAIVQYFDDRSAIVADKLSASFGLAKEESVNRLEQALDDIDWTWKDFPGLVEPFIAAVAVPAGTAAVSELGLFDDEVLEAMTRRAVSYARARAAELIGMEWIGGVLIPTPNSPWSIAETTRLVIRALVVAAIGEGQSTGELSRSIRDATAFSRKRAENIARTEVAQAQIEGQHAGWIATEVVAGKEFSAAPDCCPICQSYNGTIVRIDEDFPFPVLPHPQCRCDTLPVLPENMPNPLTGEP